MNNDLSTSVGGRDIYFRADGALNGNILTVACLIVWADDKSPIDDLVISRSFLSGNYLAYGDLKSFNEYYDTLTGTYWFDIKVANITEAVQMTLQTSGTVHGKEIPVRFDLNLPGPSPLVVSPITFDGSVMRFEVGTTEGKLLRYPLSVKAVREIDGSATAIPSKEKRIPYAFYTPIGNGTQETYAVMGMAEVDGVKHNWVARTTVKTNDGTVTAEQVGENLIGVTVKLDTPNKNVEVDLPVKFQFANGTYGIANGIQDFSIIDDVIYFDLPVSDIKDQEKVTFKFHLNETNNQNAPVFLMGTAPVKRWSNGQTQINVVIDSHTFKRNLETLYAHVFWADGTPVKGFRLKDVTPGCESGVVDNKIVLARKYVPDIHKQNNLTLSGKVDLSPFGIEGLVPFESSLTVGSDVLPARMVSALGTVDNDDVYFHLSIRQNNGDIFKNVVFNTFNGQDVVKNQNYDADQGIVSFTVPNTAVNVKDERTKATIDMVVTADSDYPFTFNGTLKVEVPYQVKAAAPVWRYRKDTVTGQMYVDATWVVKGNDDNYPLRADITDIKLNGMTPKSYTKVYNQSFGALTVSVPINLVHGAMLFISAMATASGSGTFIQLPAVSAKYREPGKATYAGHEFVGKEKVKVFFDIQGWGSEVPNEVQLDDSSWNRVKGVKLGKTYSEYDNKKGLLTVVFDIYDYDAKVFEASTTMKFNFADQTTYPIEFSFTK